jgi:hypothetical protein
MLPPSPPNPPLPPTLQRFYVATITTNSAITSNSSEIYLTDGIANSANPSEATGFYITAITAKSTITSSIAEILCCRRCHQIRNYRQSHKV